MHRPAIAATCVLAHGELQAVFYLSSLQSVKSVILNGKEALLLSPSGNVSM